MLIPWAPPQVGVDVCLHLAQLQEDLARARQRRLQQQQQVQQAQQPAPSPPPSGAPGQGAAERSPVRRGKHGWVRRKPLQETGGAGTDSTASGLGPEAGSGGGPSSGSGPVGPAGLEEPPAEVPPDIFKDEDASGGAGGLEGGGREPAVAGQPASGVAAGGVAAGGRQAAGAAPVGEGGRQVDGAAPAEETEAARGSAHGDDVDTMKAEAAGMVQGHEHPRAASWVAGLQEELKVGAGLGLRLRECCFDWPTAAAQLLHSERGKPSQVVTRY